MTRTTREKSYPEYSERPGEITVIIEKGRTTDVGVGRRGGHQPVASRGGLR